jgi:signal transduction histidine kinase
MGQGRFTREPANESPRLIPQPDGYADYIQPPGQGQHRAGHRRGPIAARQRSIRSTIIILLVIPLLSLVALWAYAASSTVGGALAKQDSDALNRDVGGPLAALIGQVDIERAETFAWQSAHGRIPRTAVAAQRPRTDAAIAAFRAGVAAAAGVMPAAAKPTAAAILAKLSQLSTVRAEVDSGKVTPLAAFKDYDAAVDLFYPFGTALANPQESLALFLESEAAIDEGQAVEDIAREAGLVGGALASGGLMPAAEQALFGQTVEDQRLLEQLGDSPIYWQQDPDTYLAVIDSPAFASFQALENKIIGMRPGTRLPVNPAAWQAGVGSILASFTAAETAERMGVTRGDTHAGDVILLRLILVGGAGLIAVVISSLLLLGFGNRISRELTGLRGAVRALANERLPSVVGRLRAGDDVDVDAEAPPLALRTRTREVTETADAFSAVQRTAVEAAVEEPRLRKGVSLVFRSLSRRNQSLLQRQLKMLDEMERGTEDPEALAQLFRLDHLTTRMRRQAEGLIILSGAAPGRGWRQPVPVVEVLRGAIGEIEDFARVDLITDSPDFLQGAGVADVTHLLAELIENAVLYSPPATRVHARCGRVANGYVIEIEDRGLGIPESTMRELNGRLARPPEFDLADSDQLGLFVVSRLAARHQIKVTLRASGYGGTLAIVLLPHSLVVSENEVVFLAAQQETAARTAARTAPPPRVAVAAADSGLPRRQPMASMAP